MCILSLIFPIYKFSDFNYGITRSDSFPSIQLLITKKNYTWEFDIKKFKDCSKINLNIRDNISQNKHHTPENVLNYFKYLYFVLNLQNSDFKFNKDFNSLENQKLLQDKEEKYCSIDEENIY